MKSSLSRITPPNLGHYDEVLRLERIGMRYGRGPEILRDVDLTLRPASFTFLTGPSGAGKTSLLNLIYMALRPSRGLVHLFGAESSGFDSNTIQQIRQRIGIVYQEFQLIDHLNVFENVALPLRVAGITRADYHRDVCELLQWVGLGRRMMAYPSTLSGGEKQRAAIARAVIAKPELLIADEPTGNVDDRSAERLLRLFMEMNRMGTAVLIATHDQKLLRGVEARILHIRGGHLREEKGP